MNELRTSFPSSRRRFATAGVTLLVFLGTGFLGRCAPLFEDSTLAANELEVIPDLSRVGPVFQRPLEPFVMANLLSFKDLATGENFAGLTGEEAYGIYLDAIGELQASIGSRLIWAGAVRDQIVGSSEPVFDSIALLEYADPLSFLGFALSTPPEAAAARSAGLFGQWLVASTSLEEPEHSRASTSPGRSEASGGPPGLCQEGHPGPPSGSTTPTGLSLEQLCRVLDGPASEPVFIVELLRFADGTGGLYQPYQDALATAHEKTGGELVWRGSLDTYVLGIVEPGFDEMVVTRYPDPRAYLRTLRRPEVLAASSARAEGLELHWVYSADDVTGQIGL